jgi:hypothetical protein
LDQIAHGNPQDFGNPQKRVEANPLLAALNSADVVWVQFRLFRQLLLAHSSPRAVLPDCLAQDFELLTVTRHSRSKNQKRLEANTHNMGVFLLASLTQA